MCSFIGIFTFKEALTYIARQHWQQGAAFAGRTLETLFFKMCFGSLCV